MTRRSTRLNEPYRPSTVDLAISRQLEVDREAAHRRKANPYGVRFAPVPESPFTEDQERRAFAWLKQRGLR